MTKNELALKLFIKAVDDRIVTFKNSSEESRLLEYMSWFETVYQHIDSLDYITDEE